MIPGDTFSALTRNASSGGSERPGVMVMVAPQPNRPVKDRSDIFLGLTLLVISAFVTLVSVCCF